MNSHTKVQQRELTTEALNELIIESIQDIKGKNIIKLDMRKLDDAPTDYFIICEGDSNTQVKAIADHIQKRLKREADTFASHVEGDRNALWVCIDYFTTVAHVFHKERRSFYELESLWSDAQVTEYKSL
ncbi:MULTISPECIES: ribosome silencing factor [Phaeodactylibacter]|uniref:Ribosomal silencing factor RsfS n=1 Tax=Phaeodactylibacter xiamenensis TaxID=1524460 RepID=A0A098S7Y4_9BACT|nr:MULTISPECIES: ribosome silencing factor [Phaeodactylibacter]MCR9051871.1 ribosome silencing factor [bacterium]KGE88215.1 iojap family protein [Phaeodactylibacter xiamenensis]MCI4647988.1 ribosome silencing factor [Phaeodactylibacter sp.]MCI5089713.1 ribosome silencing factor [Phaeodactylibacter sp.]MCR9100688.1 ribosome silencing factor [bacterium]